MMFSSFQAMKSPFACDPAKGQGQQRDQATGQAVDRAVDTLLSNECVLFPTETFFGLGCDARSEAAVALVYQAKGRQASKPLPLTAASAAMVADFCDTRLVPQQVLALWPAPLTLVLPARVPLAGPLLDAKGRVAIRVSPHPVPTLLSRRLGAPVTATSANLQGLAPATRAQDIDPRLAGRFPLLDLPPAPAGGLPSTIVSFPAPHVLKIHRQGAFPAALLARIGFTIC